METNKEENKLLAEMISGAAKCVAQAEEETKGAKGNLKEEQNLAEARLHDTFKGTFSLLMEENKTLNERMFAQTDGVYGTLLNQISSERDHVQSLLKVSTKKNDLLTEEVGYYKTIVHLLMMRTGVTLPSFEQADGDLNLVQKLLQMSLDLYQVRLKEGVGKFTKTKSVKDLVDLLSLDNRDPIIISSDIGEDNVYKVSQHEKDTSKSSYGSYFSKMSKKMALDNSDNEQNSIKSNTSNDSISNAIDILTTKPKKSKKQTKH